MMEKPIYAGIPPEGKPKLPQSQTPQQAAKSTVLFANRQHLSKPPYHTMVK
jgi:hypothetical protein